MRSRHLLNLGVFLFALLAPALLHAQSITIQGRVSDTSGNPILGASTQFRVQILTADAARCVLYDETQTVNLSGTYGMFTINLNNGSGTVNAPTTYNLDQALSNRTGFAVNSTYCASGSGTVTWSPAVTDNRKVVIQFRDPGSMTSFESIPEMDLNPVPYAIEARSVNGYTASSMLRIENAGVPGLASPLSSAQYTELQSLVAGTSTNYMSSSGSSGAGARLPTYSGSPASPTAGSIWFDSSGGGSLKYYDGSTVQTIGTGTGSGDITGVTAGTGLSGGGTSGGVTLSLATSGVTAASYGSATQVPVLTVDAYGRITAASTTAITGVLPTGTAGQYLRSDGTSWSSQKITMADLKSTIGGADLFSSPGCTAAQGLYWDSGTDQIKCQNIAINASAITAGTIADARLADVGTAGTYKVVTTDAKGRVTSGSNPTTLAGFGITDAVLNGGGIPAASSGLLAARPIAGTAGRLFVSTDNLTLYRDNGTTWDIIGAAGGGTTITEVSAGTGLSGGGTSGNVTLNLTNVGTAGTYAKVTTDAQGRVTAGTTLADTDIPNLNWSKINAGKPTTLSGYGITDSVANAGNAVSLAAGTAAARPAFGTAGRFYFATDTKTLSYDTSAAWVDLTSGSGAVASVAVTAPIVNNGTGVAPNIGISQATTSQAGYLSSTDWNTFNNKLSSALNSALIWVGNGSNVATPVAPGGDVSMTNAGLFTVAKIQGTAVTSTAPSSGQFFTYNGTNWAGKNINLADLKSTSAGTPALFPAPGCTAAQALYWDSGTDQIKCQAIAIDAAAITSGTIDPARLPASVSPWSVASGNVYRSTGNVGIGSASPAAPLDVVGDVKTTTAFYAPLSYIGRLYTSSQSAALPGFSFVYSNDTGMFEAGSAGSHALGFSTAGSERVRIDASGNLGIGSTAPTARLNVLGAATGATASFLRVGASDIGDSIALGNGTATASRVQPTLAAESNNSGYAGLSFVARGPDAGGASTVPYMQFKAGTNVGDLISGTPAAVVNRPLFQFTNASTAVMTMLANGSVGIGTTAPSAMLQLKAGTATAGTAPLKFTSGTNLTTPEDGAMEYNGSTYYLTVGSTRYAIPLAGGTASYSTVSAGAGAVGTPSYTFSGDTDTGFFASAANSIGVATGGAKVFDFSSAGMVSPTAGGGAVSSAAGTAATPTYSFAGDLDTGWYSPAANVLAAATGGTERMRMDASGNISVGTLSGTSSSVMFSPSLTQAGFMRFTTDASANWIQSGTDSTLDSRKDLRFSSSFGGNTFMTIQGSNGNVGIGTTGPLSRLHVANNADLVLDDSSPFVITRSTTYPTANVQTAGIGYLSEGAASSTNLWPPQAAVSFFSTENHTASAKGTSIVFATTPNGSTSYQSRMTVDQSGNVGIGTSVPSTKLNVIGTSWLDNASGDTGPRSNGLTVSSAPSANYVSGTDPGDGLRTMSVIAKGVGRSVIMALRNIDVGGFWDVILDGNDSSKLKFAYVTGLTSTPAVTFTGGGTVGIGTTVPTGKLTIMGASNGAPGPGLLTLNATGNASFLWGSETLGPNLTTGNSIIHLIGQAGTTANSGYLGFRYVGAGSASNHLTLGTFSNDHIMNITAGGLVGIGTTAPNTKLQVLNDGTGAQANFDSPYGSMRLFGGWTDGYSYLEVGNQGFTGNHNGLKITGANGGAMPNLYISSSNTTVNGNFFLTGIQAYATGYYLCNYSGTINYGASCSSSDIRLKKNVKKVENSLAKILRLEGAVTWDWIDPARGPNQNLGLVAQDVIHSFPEAVSLNSDGYYSIKYESMVAPLVDAVKTLYHRWMKDSQAIHSDLNGLKAKNQELERRLASEAQANEELRRNNELMRAYLCEKDPKAAFCKQ